MPFSPSWSSYQPSTPGSGSSFVPANLGGSQFFNQITGQGGVVQGAQTGIRPTNLSGYGTTPQSQIPANSSANSYLQSLRNLFSQYAPRQPQSSAPPVSLQQQVASGQATPGGRSLAFAPGTGAGGIAINSAADLRAAYGQDIGQSAANPLLAVNTPRGQFYMPEQLPTRQSDQQILSDPNSSWGDRMVSLSRMLQSGGISQQAAGQIASQATGQQVTPYGAPIGGAALPGFSGTDMLSSAPAGAQNYAPATNLAMYANQPSQTNWNQFGLAPGVTKHSGG